MTSVFQVLAADDSDRQTNARVAARLSAKRVEERFGGFLKAASNDFDERLDLVKSEIDDVVTAACNEKGVDPKHILATVIDSYKPQPQQRTASTEHEARKPKLCPYHNEVMGISLAQGEARAGYDAMAQHAWGAKHCQGDEYEGNKCNFKPEMTTQSYWDDKAEAREKRREEREQAEQQEQNGIEETPEVVEEETPEENTPEVNEDGSANLDNVIEVDFSDSDEGGEAAGDATEEVPMSMAASDTTPLVERTAAQKQSWGNPGDGYNEGLDEDGVPSNRYPGQADDVASCGRCGEPNAQVGHPCPTCGYEGGPEEDPAFGTGPPPGGHPGFGGGHDNWGADYHGASTDRVAEALKTVDVTQGGETPEPKIDKREWTPENVKKRLDTEGEGSPHPTKEVDILEKIDYTDDDLRAQTDAVTEKQDVEKKAPAQKGKGGTFPKGKGDPVTSAAPVETNPIREILEEEDSVFPTRDEVTSAIAAYKS